jgi:hypothetical protein
MGELEAQQQWVDPADYCKPVTATQPYLMEYQHARLEALKAKFICQIT